MRSEREVIPMRTADIVSAKKNMCKLQIASGIARVWTPHLEDQNEDKTEEILRKHLKNDGNMRKKEESGTLVHPWKAMHATPSQIALYLGISFLNFKDKFKLIPQQFVEKINKESILKKRANYSTYTFKV